jgi:protein-tyrosine phosphatase
MKIIFVCLGNICRSPIAEGILATLVQENNLKNIEISSSSTNSYHTGEAPHHLSQKICRKHNIDISNQHAKKITVEEFNYYDKIIVMAEDVYADVKRILGNQFQEDKIEYFMKYVSNADSLNVPDPWYGGEEDFVKVFDIIHNGCENILLQCK